MAGRLPDDLFTRVKRLLLPHVQTVEERRALLAEAFYIRDRRLYYEVQLEGAPDVFAVNCAAQLVEQVVEPGANALGALLAAVRSRYGAIEQSDIDDLVRLLDAAVPPAAPPAPLPAATPPAPQPARSRPSTRLRPTAARRCSSRIHTKTRRRPSA